ncbi:MAG: flagellin FliC [Planctomycetes bacterium]|nr:flagellin FliC [Planctomycetota bacterium]
MGLRIRTNMLSLVAQRGLAQVTDRIAGNFRRLSTGLRINTAADDAAGLAISERMRAQIRSLEQAGRNAADGISLMRTAEGSLDEVSNILIRLRELAVQSSNGSVSSQDRATIDEEFRSLIDEVDRVARGTEFNGIKLLDGSATTVIFQIGYGTTDGVDRLGAALAPVLATSLGLSGLGISTAAGANSALGALDTAIDGVSRVRGRFGAMQNRLESTVRSLGVQAENLTAAESRIRDVDVAKEMADLVRNQILQQAVVSLLAQANQQPQLVLRLLQN